MIRVILFNTLLLVSFFASAQDHHGHEHTDLHKYHFGVGGTVAYLKGEPGFAPGAHLHFIRQFGHQNRWGIGLGFEAIFDEHKHNGVNFLINCHPLKHLSINAGPGVVLSEHDGENERKPAFHTEAVYEFNVGKFHLGPMAGFGFDREDAHFSVGVHVGMGL
ncbi:MAG: hypothetical protein GX792_02130 [Bacteroidales bacterium]|jgi:hypothetical protein|nr:hypothetical protein [Bacteroidales bacterium]